MPRTLEVTAPPEVADRITRALADNDGVIALQRYAGASVQPSGDVVVVQVLDDALSSVQHMLDDHGVGDDPRTTLVSSNPASVVSKAQVERTARDSSEASWEEIESLIGRESNGNVTTAAAMALAGCIAAIGAGTGAVHLVIGAMIIAPGFQPIARTGLGLVSRGPGWRRGLVDFVKLYLGLAVGALVGGLLLAVVGDSSMVGGPSYHTGGELVRYWSQVSPTSVFIASAAALAGGLLLTAHRSALIGGVMVALALVPSLAIAVTAAMVGDWSTVGGAALRWVVDVLLTLLGTTLVFTVKARSAHRRSSRL